jgi:methyl-accepting chemotaxis protein
VTLANRLQYRQKFALFAAIFSIPVGLMLFLLISEMDKGIGFARKEKIGIEYHRPVIRLLTDIQQHAGMTHAILSGDAVFVERRRAKQADIAADIREMEIADEKWGKFLGAREKWTAVKDKWQALQDRIASLEPAESVAEHADVIADLVALASHVADTSNLTVDPDIKSYYLIDTLTGKLPALIQTLGRARDEGIGPLVRKSLRPAEKKDLIVLRGVTDSLVDWVNTNTEKIFRYSPSLRKSLEAPAAEVMNAPLGIMEVLTTKVIDTSDFDMAPAEYFARGTAAIDACMKLYDALTPALDAMLQERIDGMTAKKYTAIAVSLAVILLVAYLLAGTLMSIIRAVKSLEQAAAEMASGNLSVCAEVETRDEIARIAVSFNRMAAEFRQLITNVVGLAENVSKAAAHLADSSARITEGSHRQSEAASATSAAVQEITVSIDQVAEGAREAVRISDKTGELSVRGEAVAQDAAREMARIAETVARSAELIGRLDHHSAEISGIVKVIRDIAEQTNLLALNAAIEAARAGEHGRGFAVVADAVRKLADRTGSATGEIGGKIEAIQDRIREIILDMERSVARVGEGVGLAHQAAEALKEINTNATMTVTRIRDIAGAAAEQTAAANEMAREAETIAGMAEANAAVIGEMSRDALRLKHLSVELQTEIGKFRL